jgi:hypothetical protein
MVFCLLFLTFQVSLLPAPALAWFIPEFEPVWEERNDNMPSEFPVAFNQREFTCDHCSSFIFSDDSILLRGYGHAWSRKELFNLKSGKLSVDVDFSLDSVGSEIIFGFSSNKKDWNSGEADALSFSIEGNGLIRLRSGMFAAPIAFRNLRGIRLKEWQHLEIVFQVDRFIARIDGESVLEADLSKVTFPTAGSVGIIGFRNEISKIKNLALSSK